LFEEQEQGRAEGPPERSARPHEDDLRLAREALRGSPAARHRFAEIMLCVPKFVAVINARQARPLSPQELEDVTQETLIQVWRRLDSYAGLASLQTWAYRFCQRTLSTHRRGLRRRDRTPEPVEPLDQPARPERQIDFGWVHAALDKLREPDLTIVRHRHFDQMSFVAIARRLEMPESSAKAAYRRALARLRDLLGREMREEGS
jgi:RNA polymerase sigma factor (sigma-70 family)